MVMPAKNEVAVSEISLSYLVYASLYDDNARIKNATLIATLHHICQNDDRAMPDK